MILKGVNSLRGHKNVMGLSNQNFKIQARKTDYFKEKFNNSQLHISTFLC